MERRKRKRKIMRMRRRRKKQISNLSFTKQVTLNSICLSLFLSKQHESIEEEGEEEEKETDY